MQLATSLTPIDALGSPEDQVHPTEIPPDFFFSFSCVWSIFPHLTLHLLLSLQP